MRALHLVVVITLAQSIFGTFPSLVIILDQYLMLNLLRY